MYRIRWVFGFIEHKGKHIKIPQLGNVVIEDDVEIGSNTTIDRGRFSSTVIGGIKNRQSCDDRPQC